MFDLPTTTILVLLVAAFAAGLVDAIAGGGGLITVPALLLAGLPPVEALGTNKLQALFGSGTATFAYARRGLVDSRREAAPFLLALAGSGTGALLAGIAPVTLLERLLPGLLIAVAIYFAFKRRLDDSDRHRRLPLPLFRAVVPSLIGFYDGLFGPGTGSFLMLAYVGLAGFGILKATAHSKLVNFASNVGAFAVFAVLGAVQWWIGLAMGTMQLAGARLGAALALRHGAWLIRPLLVVVCIALAVRLLLPAG